MTRSKFFSSWVLACVAAIGLSGEMFAQTGYPMLMSIRPIAAQAGATSEHEVDSRYNMYGAYQVLVSGQGVVGEVVTKMDDKNTNKKNLTTLKVRFKVEKDALPGVRDVRVATPQGVSTLGQLVIASDPVFMESKPNNTMPQAEAITLPVTLCGRVEANEDVDFFKFKVEAGKTLQFHCRSNRLQNRIHDLQEHSDIIFSIRNSTGTTVAQVDNYFAADPFLSYRFEQAGEYFLEIRDVRYKGNTYWGYSIEISERPFVQTAHPLAVTAGKSSTIAPIGAMIPPNAQIPVTLPASLGGHQFVRLPLAGSSSNPVQLFATNLPITVESGSENDTVEKAQPITVPGVVAGRIEKTADMDCFSFTAKKGERFTFEVHARRLDSSMDPFLNIRNEKGAILFGNDDMQLHKGSTADSRIEFWAAPADGKYVVEVRDVHLRGGDAFTYAVEITRATPYFELYLDTDKTLLTPGTSAVLFARVVRKNGFKGAVDLAISGLPKGVQASCGQIPEAGTDACIILTAPPAAPLAVSNIQVTGSGVHKDEAGKTTPLNRTAVPLQEIYMPGGGRWHWIVDSHAVSVGAPGDIRSVKLSTYDITLKPGESKKIEVTIERAPGFNSNVTLDLIYQHLGTKFGDTLPKGMSIDGKTSKTLLSSTDSKGTLTITAAADAAPVEKQQLSVMANISLNFVMKATYSASPLRVTVLKK